MAITRTGPGTATRTGGWFFCLLKRDAGKLLAVPIAKFTPDIYFEAKPIERLWVEKTFEREQKKWGRVIKASGMRVN